MTFKQTYEEMLERAFKLLPKQEKATSRFEMPSLHGSIQGNKTIISNLPQVASHLRREQSHVLKFLLRELATMSESKASGTIFIGKFSGQLLNTKLEKYVKEFVLCAQCSKPDTALIKEKGVTFKRCEACGAKTSVRTLK